MNAFNPDLTLIPVKIHEDDRFDANPGDVVQQPIAAQSFLNNLSDLHSATSTIASPIIQYASARSIDLIQRTMNLFANSNDGSRSIIENEGECEIYIVPLLLNKLASFCSKQKLNDEDVKEINETLVAIIAALNVIESPQEACKSLIPIAINLKQRIFCASVARDLKNAASENFEQIFRCPSHDSWKVILRPLDSERAKTFINELEKVNAPVAGRLLADLVNNGKFKPDIFIGLPNERYVKPYIRFLNLWNSIDLANGLLPRDDLLDEYPLLNDLQLPAEYDGKVANRTLEQLITFRMGPKFNQSFKGLNLSKMKHLVIGNDFDKPLEGLENSRLEVLEWIGKNQSIKNLDLSHLRILKIRTSCENSLKGVNLRCLEELWVGANPNAILKSNPLPNLRRLMTKECDFSIDRPDLLVYFHNCFQWI
ncbi:MAG: hypothetical protein Q8K75_05040 [Chlamydiales bacterium]|nr:hypothetical protein [Chlamydiales bacterium]